MKKTKKFMTLALALACGVGLASCTGDKPVTPVPETPTVTVAEVKATAKANFAATVAKLDRGSYSDDDLAIFDQIASYANMFLEGATTVDGVNDALSTINTAWANQIAVSKKYASGVFSFVASSYDERTEILGILEKYAYEHFLTGFSLIDDGGYSIASTTVQRGVNTYVSGYGWATLSDGEIVGDLSGETNAAWKRYYHTFVTSDPKHVNYMDDKGSVVGNLQGYITSAYWDTRLNITNDGYEYYNLLAKEMPQAVNANENTGLATKYSWKIKTGADGFKYSTLTTNSTLSAFNGRDVAAEDYLTPYKLYYTKAYGYARSAEKLTGSGSIKGTKAYYDASADGFNEEAWANVGLKVELVDGEYVMSVEFNNPCTPFYAMYYMMSGMQAPVPQEFIDTLGSMKTGDGSNTAKGASLWGKTNVDLGLSPVDTWLSTGVYTLESWVEDQAIVMKRNPGFTFCGEDKYKIAGVHFAVLTSASTDKEAAWKELKAGKLSACGVPSTQTQDRNTTDEGFYSYYTPGSGNYKLNVNTCTQEVWNQLFGPNGTITKTPEADTWVCEPAMSNADFLLGLSWSLDRKTIADRLGVGVSVDYFGDGYLADPENGVVYNTTEAHKAAASAVTLNGQYKDAYNLEIAKEYFASACEKFIADGTYHAGDRISLELAWQTQSQYDDYGNPIIQMWTEAFNAVGAEYGLTLEVVNWSGAVWYDVYYDKMMVGQFDIGFGGVTGNSLNPLNFIEVLKSDNSSGFTLNWGSDTSAVNLEYKGLLWSFDSLWQAADTGGYFYQGVYTPAVDPSLEENAAGDAYAEGVLVANADGSYTINVDVNPIENDDIVVKIDNVKVTAYVPSKTVYECTFVYDAATGKLAITLDAAAAAKVFGDANAYKDTVYGHYFKITINFANEYKEVPANETKELDDLAFEYFTLPTPSDSASE